MSGDGYAPLDEAGTFLGHVGGLEWRRDAADVATRVTLLRLHTNPNGTVHGGLMTTLLDVTLGLAALRAVPDAAGHPATVSLTTNFLGAAREGELLEGEGRVDAATRTLTFTSGRLHVGGRTVATGTAVFRNPRTTAGGGAEPRGGGA